MLLGTQKRQHSTTLITDWQTFHRTHTREKGNSNNNKKKGLVCVSFALLDRRLFFSVSSLLLLFFFQRFSHSFFIAHFILLENTSLTIKALKCSTSRSLDIVSLDIYSLCWFSQTNQMWQTFGCAGRYRCPFSNPSSSQ